LLAAECLGTAARGEIAFDPRTRSVLVTGFPADRPATLEDLRAADRAGKWGIVQHRQTTETTTLDAGLRIGQSDGTSSFLRIGCREQPSETLVVKGDVWIRSPREKSYATYEGQNGLLLGVEGGGAVSGVLKFDCAKAGEFGLKADRGTTLRCVNSQITAAVPDRAHAWRGAVAFSPGGEFAAVNSLFSHFDHLYPFETVDGVVRGCVFEHGLFPVGNGAGRFEDCTFRNLETALLDGGCLDVTLLRCRFQDNHWNWRLMHTQFGIRAVDCSFGEPRSKEVVCSRWNNPQTGQWQYPMMFSQRHIVVSVRDASGRPVVGARVSAINAEGDASAVVHGSAVTGPDGRTPGLRSGKALFLTEFLVRATEDAHRPLQQRYTYTLTVSADDHALVRIEGVHPEETWTVKEVVLGKR